MPLDVDGAIAETLADPEYRLLRTGEVFQVGDEYYTHTDLFDTRQQWVVVAAASDEGSEGKVYDSETMVPARRLIDQEINN